MLNGVNFAVCLSNGSWSKPPSCLPAARSATTQISPSSLLASTAATFPMVKSTATPSRAVSGNIVFKPSDNLCNISLYY